MKRKQSEGRKKLYSTLMNCTAPALTAVFLAGSACWAAELQYGEPVEYDRSPEAAEVLSENKITTEDKVDLLPDEYTETALPVSDVALENNNFNSGAELVEACGIYIGDEFVGAVSDSESVEQELSKKLEDYREDENIIEADFAVEPDIKQGLYRTEALVDEKDMAEFLTGEKKVVEEYTAEEQDTPEKVAEDFGMSVDEIKELNPEIEKIQDGEQLKVKKTVSVLPVKYTREEQEEEIIELDSYVYDENFQLVSDAIKGKKLSLYEVTYIDGDELSRKLTSSETIQVPTEQELYNNDEQSEEIENEPELQKSESLYSESVPETDEISSSGFIWPVNGGYISDTFGSDRNHKGLDIAAPAGTDIFASDGGTVLEAGWNDGGYGNYVMIDHGNGYVTLYGHASEVYVSAGDTVSQGQLIAAVGTTGDSTGNHCHFEVRYAGGFLNPQDFV